MQKNPRRRDAGTKRRRERPQPEESEEEEDVAIQRRGVKSGESCVSVRRKLRKLWRRRLIGR